MMVSLLGLISVRIPIWVIIIGRRESPIGCATLSVLKLGHELIIMLVSHKNRKVRVLGRTESAQHWRHRSRGFGGGLCAARCSGLVLVGIRAVGHIYS